jgi:hypothetical protein
VPIIGAIVPHAPLLVDGVSSANHGDVLKLRAAVAALELEGLDALVLLSPHGVSSGIYVRPAGSLAAFGLRGIEVERRTDGRVFEELVQSWGPEVLETDCDHGIVVPLALGLGRETKVVATTFAEVTGPYAGAGVDTALTDAAKLAVALEHIAEDRAIGVVASVNTSAALSARAPMGELADAQTIESELIGALERDVGAALPLLRRLHFQGWSCASGPLAVLARLLEGSRAEVKAYGAPFGVGYLVARVA